MKKSAVLWCALLLGFALSGALLGMEKGSWTGEVIDLDCYLDPKQAYQLLGRSIDSF